MKIGNIYVTREETLLHHPAYREIINRMARSEVKNYLAELAEQAGLPFPGAAEFLASAAGRDDSGEECRL